MPTSTSCGGISTRSGWWPTSPSCGSHGQQRLDRAARQARQVEGENKAAMRRLRRDPGRAWRHPAAPGRRWRYRRPGRRCDAVISAIGAAANAQPLTESREVPSGAPTTPERLDRDQDRLLARPDHRRGAAASPRRRSRTGRVAPRLETARGADPDVMQQRVVRLLAPPPALFEVKRAVEIGDAGCGPRARPPPDNGPADRHCARRRPDRPPDSIRHRTARIS